MRGLCGRPTAARRDYGGGSEEVALLAHAGGVLGLGWVSFKKKLPYKGRWLPYDHIHDGCRNQNADLLGSLAGLSFPVVYVGVVECASASPYTYSSTHRFPDERTPIETTPLSATSAELGLGLGLRLGLGSHSSSHAPLLLATLLSHNIPLPRVH